MDSLSTIRELKEHGTEVYFEKFTEDDWCIMVEKVTVYTGRIVFTLVTGAEIEA